MKTLTVLLLAVMPVYGQGATLVLSSAFGAPGEKVTLDLTLSGSTPPGIASLQWDLTYPAGFTLEVITAVAGKAVDCPFLSATSARCVLRGFNTNALPDGVVATVTVALPPRSFRAVATIDIKDVVAAGIQNFPLGVGVIGVAGRITNSVRPRWLPPRRKL